MNFDAGIDRYTGLSVNNELMVKTEQAAEWKINLYKWLKSNNHLMK
jgi:hypothetical protein